MVEVASLSTYVAPDSRAQSSFVDLVEAAMCGQFKSAPARGERVVRYNRLLETETTNFLLRSSEVIEK